MLALIAGRGRLPGELVRRLDAPAVICAMVGAPPDDLDPDLTFRLETLGTLLADLKARDVTRICLAGDVGRPAIDPAAIDSATLPLVPVIQAALSKGDDGKFRAAIAIFEHAGLTVVAAHDLAPDLLPEPGCPTRTQPDAAHRKDAARAVAIHAAMAAADVGQACVVLNGQPLALEGAFGTDWMLSSLQQRDDDGQGGLLFKAPKPGQDRRVDLPAIGPDTVAGALRAGLSGIVIEAGGVMVLDPDGVQSACDRAGVFLWIRDPQG